MSRPFVHLHCHSHYSLLDGASRIEALVDRAKELGMNSLALTDHGNLYGALEFYRACRAADMNPILGYEAYVAPGSRFDKGGGTVKDSSDHLTLLAQNRTGFQNLIKLASRAFLEGFYHRPRIDRELIEQYNEGIICLSGCLSSEFSRALVSGRGGHGEELAKARAVAAWYQKIFNDRYYIEIQNNGLEIQSQVMAGAVEVAEQMGLPLVATCDAHYVYREDAEAQDVLVCINTGKFRTDTNRMKMEGDAYYLREPETMYALFPDHEDAVRRSQRIADSIHIELELGNRHFPSFTPPESRPSGDYLRELCLSGLKERYAKMPHRWRGNCPSSGELSDDVMARLQRELSVIDQLGFNDYFLIVWDFVRYAIERNIPCTARGSGVGSLVCYALRMSHVCPLEYDLLFERFLDENRLEAPDIDIDFCKERRGEVIQYVKDKYGDSNVAQIGTFGTLAARAAIRDVGRTLGWPIFRVDQIVGMVPDQLGITLDKALEQSDELRAAYHRDREVKELIDLARKVEGSPRNVGTHAAAVVIAERPIDEYVPLQHVKGKSEVITQWAMGDVAAAGLLKMDFLGLKNLTILAKSIELVEQTTGQRIDPYHFPLDDPDTYALLCRGETKGIFQLESGGIRDLLQRMKPDHFRDIIATNALYRPGPLEGGMVDQYIEVKHGRKPAHYAHPVMEEILAETHGVMVYQEQVMRILNRLGRIQLSDAYTCIKAISKKKLPVIAKFREEFIEGAAEQGLAKRQAENLFDMIEKFAGYGFNKSHSTAYALIAYMTAYLKAHFPVEFMAALLSGDIPGRNFKSKDSLVEHFEDCQRMHIEVVPPNVNLSGVDFEVRDNRIHFALSAIKSCGIGAAQAIVSAQKQGGPFRSLFDFCERIDPQDANRATLEALIKAGAMDSLGAHRGQLLAGIDRAMQSGVAVAADRRSGQKSLFDDFEDEDEIAPLDHLPDGTNLDEKELLIMEKEFLGFYLSRNPLEEFQEILQTYCSHPIQQLGSLEHRTEVIVGGMIAALVFKHTKKPQLGSSHTKYAMWDLEDTTGMIRCIMWPESYAEFAEHVQPDAILAMRGTIDRRPGREEVHLIISELIPLSLLPTRFTSGVLIRIDESRHGEDTLAQLKEIVRGYPGGSQGKQLQLRLDLTDGSSVHLDCPKLRLDITSELRRRVDELLGPGNFRLVRAAPPPKSKPDNHRGTTPAGRWRG
ncbi:MAG: DNA polymerase III subunit alpha [Pirellulales bacterium]|nr:DNA polymerase III subunit alpha [Pirellulales bacterium]